MKRILLVTNELYPFTVGGIGVVVAGLLGQISDGGDMEAHVLFVGADPPSGTRLSAMYPKVVFHALDSEAGVSWIGNSIYAPRSAFESEWYWRSYKAMQSIRRMAQEGCVFDWIEFPDWLGMAFCTIQEKSFDPLLYNSKIAVRIHSTDSLLRSYEPHHAGIESSLRFDLERMALERADCVVSHLPPVTLVNARFFDFSADWLAKVVHNLPPVPRYQPAGQIDRPLLQKNIVFPGKIQDFKRPDLLIRAMSEVFERVRDYSGDVVFAAHVFIDAYHDQLMQLIPERFAGRFQFLPSLPQVEREALIMQSIVVIPSIYESFCLAAYEAGMGGALLVLNGDNPAFGSETPWLEGENCLKFDGTAQDLADTLVKLLSGRLAVPGNPMQFTPSLPYFRADLEVDEALDSTVSLDSLPARVSIIVIVANDGEYLPATLDSITASNYANLEIVVADDASRDSLSRALLDRITEEVATASPGIKIIRSVACYGLGATLNGAVKHANGEFILPLKCGDLIDPGFISLAVEALRCRPEYDILVPQIGLFRQERQIGFGEFPGYKLYCGEALAVGLMENRIAPLSSLMRRSVLSRNQYNERLGHNEEWDFNLHALVNGCKFLVANDIRVFRREESIDRQPNTSSLRVESSFLERMYADMQIRIGKRSLPYLTVRDNIVAASQDSTLRLSELQASEQRYYSLCSEQAREIAHLSREVHMLRTSVAVRIALRFRDLVTRFAPSPMQALKRTIESTWQFYRRLRS